MPTAAVTFTATIPGINYRWQMGDCQARPRRVEFRQEWQDQLRVDR